MRSAISAALTLDAAGADPRDAVSEIERLPEFGCVGVEALADGSERCTQRFGPYMYKQPFRVAAYGVVARLYLNWDNVEDRFGAAERPTRALIALAARRLEGDPTRRVVAAPHVSETLKSASAVPVAAAIYHDFGDDAGFWRAMRRYCGRGSCEFEGRLFLNDLDGATRAAEAFDFEGGNMGERSIRTCHRLALLHYLIERRRPELALRIGRVLMRDYDGYPIQASQALNALFPVASCEELAAWIEEKDIAARGRPGTRSASAAAIVIRGWELLGEGDRAETLRDHWRPIAADEDARRCILAGPSTRMGEPPGEGDWPACLHPYKALMGLGFDRSPAVAH